MIDKSIFPTKNELYHQKVRVSGVETSDLVKAVYSPCRKTGFAQSDLTFMEHNQNPELRSAVERMNRVHQLPVGADNDDDAFAAIVRNDDDAISYADRMRQNFAPSDDDTNSDDSDDVNSE